MRDIGSCSITNRLTDILCHIGCSLPRTEKISRRWLKEAKKLYDVFVTQAKTTYNKQKAAEYLASAPSYKLDQEHRDQVLLFQRTTQLCAYIIALGQVLVRMGKSDFQRAEQCVDVLLSLSAAPHVEPQADAQVQADLRTSCVCC